MGCFVIHSGRRSTVPMRGCRYTEFKSMYIDVQYMYMCCVYIIKGKYMFNHTYAQNICLQQCNLEVPQGSVLSFVMIVPFSEVFYIIFILHALIISFLSWHVHYANMLHIHISPILNILLPPQQWFQWGLWVCMGHSTRPSAAQCLLLYLRVSFGSLSLTMGLNFESWVGTVSSRNFL